MKVTSIPSTLPLRLDPAVPGFAPPKNLTGCHIRITVPIEKDPAVEMAAARLSAEAAYPGALLHLVPDFSKMSLAGGTVELKGADDEALLRDYLERLMLPSDITTDRVVQYLKLFLPNLGLVGVQGLRFRSVFGTNVLCFEQVRLSLDLRGLTQVSGVNKDWGGERSNGSGKSALVGLPFLVLFGRTFKGQTHDGWAREGTDQTARLEGSLTLPDGRELIVVRTRRPPSLRVWVDKKNVTMADPNKTQDLIESLTNLTWDVLTNSVYIGQREIGSVFGTDKERKELFGRLLGLDRFLDTQEKIRKVALRRERLVKDCEQEIITTVALMTEAQRSIDEILKLLVNLPQVDDKAVREQGYEIARLRAEIAVNDRAIDAILPELERNQEAFGKLMGLGIEADVRAQKINDHLLNIRMNLTSVCPLCGSRVSVKALEAHVTSLKRDLEAAEEKIEESATEQNKNRAVRKALLEKVQEKRQENIKTARTVAELERDAEQMKTDLVVRSRLSELLKSKEARMAAISRANALHVKAREGCVDEWRFAEFCARIVGRDGLPAHLCAVTAPALNQAAARYSEVFTEGEIGLTFNSDLNLEILNLHGGKTIKGQSAGELRMAAIIAALSFRDVLVSHNILVLDEPSEGLDPISAAAFARGMNGVVERFQHVLVISHSGPLLAELEPDHRITVTKENGVSSIVSS